MQPKRVDVPMLVNGDRVRWSLDDPIVTILKVKADREGYDVLYQHNGSEPRWRGFDEGDQVYLVATGAGS